jgi:hypothetical protein
VETIERHIAAFNSDLQEARREHADLALRLHDGRGTGESGLHAQLDALEAEMAEHERKIKRMEAAKTEALRCDTGEARQAETKRLRDELARIDQRYDRLGELADAVHASFEALAPILAEYEALAADNQAGGYTILKACYEKSSQALAQHDALFDALRLNSGAVAGALADAAYASGLGRVGPRLLGLVSVEAARTKTTLDDAVSRTRGKVVPVLEQLLAAREARLNGRPASAPTAEDRFIRGGKELENRRKDGSA